MSLASAKGMLLDASAGGWAVGAFNVTSLPQMQGVVEAAVERKAPLILQTAVSPGEYEVHWRKRVSLAGECPRPDLNRDTRFRKPLLYPVELRGLGRLPKPKEAFCIESLYPR